VHGPTLLAAAAAANRPSCSARTAAASRAVSSALMHVCASLHVVKQRIHDVRQLGQHGNCTTAEATDQLCLLLPPIGPAAVPADSTTTRIVLFLRPHRPGKSQTIAREMKEPDHRPITRSQSPAYLCQKCVNLISTYCTISRMRLFSFFDIHPHLCQTRACVAS
jgi:hypothetical protein